MNPHLQKLLDVFVAQNGGEFFYAESQVPPDLVDKFGLVPPVKQKLDLEDVRHGVVLLLLLADAVLKTNFIKFIHQFFLMESEIDNIEPIVNT